MKNKKIIGIILILLLLIAMALVSSKVNAAILSIGAVREIEDEKVLIKNGVIKCTKEDTNSTITSAKILEKMNRYLGNGKVSATENTETITITYAKSGRKYILNKNSLEIFEFTSTVSFDANGGTVDKVNKTVVYLGKFGELPVATRTGYTFAGWYTEKSGGTNITSETTVTLEQNITLYAHWNINVYTVRYNGNGATSGSMTDIQCTYNQEFTNSRNKFARTGYIFKGWSTDPNVVSTQNSLTARDRKYNGATYLNEDKAINLTTENGAVVNLYAVWQRIELGVMDYRYVNGAYHYFACVTTNYKTENSSNAGALFVAMNSVGNLKFGSNAIWNQSTLRSTLNNSSNSDLTGLQQTNTTVNYTYSGQFYDSNPSKYIDTRDNDLGIAGPLARASTSEGSSSDYIFIPSMSDIYNYGISASKTSTQIPWFWDMNLDGVSDRLDMSDTVSQRTTGRYWNDNYWTKTDRYYAQASLVESGYEEFFLREHNTGHNNSTEYIRSQGVLLPGTYSYGYDQYWINCCTTEKTTRAMYTMQY